MTPRKTQMRKHIMRAGLLLAVVCMASAQTANTAIALVPAVSPGGPTFPLSRAGTTPAQTAKLTFDLGAIPAGANIVSAVLWLVPTAPMVGGTEKTVRIFPDAKFTTSIGQLTVPRLQPVSSTGNGLTTALANRTALLDLYLRTDSAGPVLQFYSDQASKSINRPRLVVSWTDDTPLIAGTGLPLKYRGDPADATPWKYAAPNGATLSTPLSALGFSLILAGPAFRGDEILLIAKQTSTADPRLYGIAWDGAKRWDYAIDKLTDTTAAWKYLIVDSANNLLAFANDGKVRVYSGFGATGPTAAASIAVPGMLLSSRPAVSAGGLITFLNNTGYVYTLSAVPGLRELWRSPVNMGKAPPPVFSPWGGDGLVYSLAIDPAAGVGLYVFDAARGSVVFAPPPPKSSTLRNFQDFHPPLTVKGAPNDWLFLTGYNNADGVLEAYNNFTGGSPGGWKPDRFLKGSISRCIAPPAANPPGSIYCVVSGQLRGFNLEGDSLCTSDTKGFGATSNLVTDGASNIYFWNGQQGGSGVFYGFDSGCKQIVAKGLNGIPTKTDGSEVLDLRAGPNGLFYVTSDQQLFAIQPAGASPATLSSYTRYATAGDMTVPASAPSDGPVILASGGKLSMGGLQVPAGANVMCRGVTGVSFGAGFNLKQGATLRCGIDAAAR